MTTPRNRSDALIERWTDATVRPTPEFRGVSSRRRSPRRLVFLVLALVALVVVVGLGTLAIGTFVQKPREDIPSAVLVKSAVAAVATAPGVRFTLKISTAFDYGTQQTDTTGVIDFAHGRFSGTAGGGGGGAPMLLFGGPSSGAAILADGLYVMSDSEPWARVPDSNAQLEAFMDPVRVSRAFRTVIDSSLIGDAVRFAPCGNTSCRVVSLSAPPAALFDAEAVMLGPSGQTPPPDFGAATIEALSDPSGCPVAIETVLKAGSTVTNVALELERLEPAPAITPPIP
jgi:hypothetical protein